MNRGFRVRAAQHSHSVEEVREILGQVVGEPVPPRNLAAAIHARAAQFGRDEIDLPALEFMRVRSGPAGRGIACHARGMTVCFVAVSDAEVRHGVMVCQRASGAAPLQRSGTAGRERE